jgi:hypothetical protein
VSTSDRFPPHPAHDDDEPESRQCSRCRQYFPVDDEPLGVDHPKWWLCPPCHDRLIGTNQPRRH